MGEALNRIREKLAELNDQIGSYVNQPGMGGELTGPDGADKLRHYMRQTETGAMSLIELFLTDETKSEVQTWAQGDKEERAKMGLQLFGKVEDLDKLLTHQGEEEPDDSEPGGMSVAGRSAAAAVMQLLCVVRGFTQLVNFFLIDATLAIVYIIRDKIQRTIHLNRGTYEAVQEAWRFRCG